MITLDDKMPACKPSLADAPAPTAHEFYLASVNASETVPL